MTAPAPAAAAAAADFAARTTTTTTKTDPLREKNADQSSPLAKKVSDYAIPVFCLISVGVAAVFALSQAPLLFAGLALGAGALTGFVLSNHEFVPFLDKGPGVTLFDVARTVAPVALAVLVPFTAPYALPAALFFVGNLVGRNFPV